MNQAIEPMNKAVNSLKNLLNEVAERKSRSMLSGAVELMNQAFEPIC